MLYTPLLCKRSILLTDTTFGVIRGMVMYAILLVKPFELFLAWCLVFAPPSQGKKKKDSDSKKE